MANLLNVVQRKGLDLLKLKKEDPILVQPAKETPKAPYFLSILDHHPSQEPALRMIYSFKCDGKGNEDAFQVLKESLSRVLVDYYPFAGRLKVGKDGKFFVECSAEGLVMVEASADCNMEEVGDLTDFSEEITNKLMHVVPDTKCITDVPPLVAQVTKFKCGGFTLGLAIHHHWVDGTAATQFINCWSETARGVPLSVPPFLDRKLLTPRTPCKPHHEIQEFVNSPEDISINVSKLYDNTEELEYRSFNLSPEKIEKLKVMAVEDGSLIKYCTTFEVCAAFIWRARTKALGFASDQEVHLVVVMDARSRFDPPLPKGYFGNVTFFCHAICKACDLVDKPLSFAVSLVQQAIKNATDAYLKAALDQRVVMFDKPWPPFRYASMLINSWARLPFNNADFGWGETLHFGPVMKLPKHGVLFLSNGKQLGGTKLLICLPMPMIMSNFEQAIEI